MRFTLIPLALAAVGALAAGPAAVTPALADGHLVGDWVGDPDYEHRGARVGSDHEDAPADSWAGNSDLVWTLTIEEQEGSAFHATWCSDAGICEDAVGVLRADGETVLLADEDGLFMGTLTGEDTMELCYLEGGADSRIADCHMLGR
ncbi:MAG: hypothetical protein GVY27_13570 [Deinococcus-Thermus bacterium]|jgi:hypothetical protein|nr:hypothetical protein [Deinococcota bacterium]